VKKGPELPKGVGSGVILEQFTKIVSQAPASGTNVEGKNDKNIPMPLIVAARNGHIKIVELLLLRGADVNVRDKEQGTTALIAAAQQGHKEIVELLLKNGADINARETSGKTALVEA
jgi:ankyrin repeat protein